MSNTMKKDNSAANLKTKLKGPGKSAIDKSKDFFDMINSYKKSVLDYEDLMNELTPSRKSEAKKNTKEPRKQMF